MENKFKISNKIKFCKLNKMWLLWFVQNFHATVRLDDYV